MDKHFHPTLHNGCNYLFLQGLKLIHVSKRATGGKFITAVWGRCNVCLKCAKNSRDWVSYFAWHLIIETILKMMNDEKKKTVVITLPGNGKAYSGADKATASCGSQLCRSGIWRVDFLYIPRHWYGSGPNLYRKEQLSWYHHFTFTQNHMATHIWVSIGWWHQTITWTKVDTSSVFCAIHLRAISQEVLMNLIRNLWSLITP